MPAPQVETERPLGLCTRVSETYECQKRDPEDDALPADPRHWSRQHVERWLLGTAARHRLAAVRPDRFLMNGKALCLMTADMFLRRVPLGGKLLYRDFQIRLARALYVGELCQKGYVDSRHFT